VDADRPLAGGPFRSCRLPITLGADQSYRIRIWQLADARKPDDPEWWGAWLINDSKGTEQLIGQLQTPGSWGWLTGAAGGFIEHFGPMPQGCASIPPSTSRYDTVKADNGAFTSSISASVYGDCKAGLDGRTAIECGGGECRVTVRDARPGAPAGISVSD
jgi:hypothetical protein